ncbi:MAG: sigma-70 family RNA polymerase sigma factor [Chthoniobacteraceae bacterium]
MFDAAPPSDEALVDATLGGDDDAYAELIRRHKRRVFGAAARFARNDHQIDDIAQEVFIRAFKNLQNFRRDAPFEHWLARITVSACYDFLRRERKHRETAPLDAVDFDMSDSSVERAISAGRAREVVGWAMKQLRPDEQLILTLCEIEERSVREVAGLTGWSEANVKVRAFRARNALKRILEDHAHES